MQNCSRKNNKINEKTLSEIRIQISTFIIYFIINFSHLCGHRCVSHAPNDIQRREIIPGGRSNKRRIYILWRKRGRSDAEE